MAIKSFFPLVIDSSMLMAFANCPMKGFRQYIQHLNGEESTDLVAGRAFARGIEVVRKAYYNEDADPHEAVIAGQTALYEDYGDHIPFKPLKTPERMAMALELYFMEYPLGLDIVKPAKLADGSYAIEYSFAHELPFQHPDIPEHNLLITGRADMLGEYADRLWVVDEKTTGSPFTKNWATQWDTRGQFTTYCWGLGKDEIKTAGAYIRGIYMGKTAIKFQECQSVRGAWQVEVWEKQMLKTVERLLECYKNWKESGLHPSEYFFGNWAESCNAYFRPCQFQDLCRSKSSEKYLEGDFDQNIWLPHEQRREKLDVFLESLGVKE